jgi:carbonic anhydrase
MVTAKKALEKLLRGNQRFVSGESFHVAKFGNSRRPELVDEQNPFAIVLGCSDSRVPLELVFDQGLGDLFVIRVAGNIVMPSQNGSVEFAADKFGTKLVVVLGHSQCGAVLATLEELEQSTESQSDSLRAIVNAIRPSVEHLVDSGQERSRYELVQAAVQANIHASVEKLVHGSEIIENLIANEKMLVVGAEYSLETGKVKVLERIHS